MERLTTNKDVSEMGMYELAHNACYAKDGKARYRDYDLDIDARELTRKLLKDYTDGDDSFTDNEDFDDWMMDYLQSGIDSMEGLLALFYRNLWAMADLRDRLAEYEDIGLTPEQIREIDRLYAEKCKELAECNKNYLTGLELANIAITMNRLKKYKDLEEKGKLMQLPCAVGDKVWDIEHVIPCCLKVTGFSLGDLNDDSNEEIKILDQVIVHYTNPSGSITGSFEAGEVGKSVFLTYKEAEAAWKKKNQGTV